MVVFESRIIISLCCLDARQCDPCRCVTELSMYLTICECLHYIEIVFSSCEVHPVRIQVLLHCRDGTKHICKD
jgi:hypothetical protein